VKFRRVVLLICGQTDRHTDTLIAVLRTATGGEVLFYWRAFREFIPYIYKRR